MLVIRVTQAAAFDDPEIEAFFHRAIVKNGFPHPDHTVIELKARVNEPQLGIFAGLDDAGKLVGLCIAQLPTSNFALTTQVLLAYNEGKRAVGDAVREAVKEWSASFGLKSVLGCNRSGKSDEVWLRHNKKAGTPTKIGSWYVYKWE